MFKNVSRFPVVAVRSGQRRATGLSLLLALLAMMSIQGCSMQAQRATAVPELELPHPRLKSGGHARVSPKTAQAEDLNRLYDAAIFDSAIFREQRQDTNLWPVTGATAMGSFVSCYQCSECDSCKAANCPNGQCPPGVCTMCGTCSHSCLAPGSVTTQSDIWVSHANQVLEFCSRFPPDEVVLRMQQLQGLPPNLDQPADSWKILSVKVAGPWQLFRPCVNGDPSTSGPCNAEFSADAPTELKAWIAGQATSAWQLPHGYPWTRQGYTYNWNPDAPSIVGTSEYVIPKGTVVEVTGLTNAITYCTGATP